MDIVTYALLNGKIKNYASNVDEWLEENVDPDTGYVLDRSLQMENAAAPADMVGDINDEVGNLKNTLSDTYDVLADTKPLQYYDKNTAPSLNLFCLSGGGIYENVIYRCFLCEINGKSGEVYSFSYSGDTTSFEISQMRVAVTNSIPAAGQNVTQIGVSDYTKMRGQITLSQDSKYFCIFVQFSSSENAETYEPIIKEGLVVSKTNLFTGIYSDYKVDGSVRYQENTDVYVGTNLLVGITPTLGTGWSGSLANGFTHASGNTEPLTIPISLGSTIYRYVLVMTDSDSRETAYTVSLGTSAQIDPYNGTSSLLMGFVMNGSEGLVIRPASWYTGTLSNIALYRLGDGLGTTKVEIEKNNIVGNGNADILDVASKWNVALGYEAFDEAVCMSRNVAVGKAALSAGRYGDRNVAVGSYTLGSMQSGNRNIAIGSDALYLATLVNDCTAIGKGSQINGSNSEYNVSVGNYSLGSNDSHAIQNVAVGAYAGFYNGTGNTSVGHKAGYYTKGSNNTAIGRYAYQLPYYTGNSNTFVGAETDCYDASASSGNIVTIDNAIGIGYGVKVTASNQMRLGNANNNDIYLGKYHLIFNDDHTVTWELV